MNGQKLIKIVTAALALSTLCRFGELRWTEWKNTQLTQSLCSLVGTPLETGNLRSIYEGIDGGLRHSGLANTCVNVTDNGRSFSPDCIQPEIQYQITMCKAEANTGVRATVMYPTESMISQTLLLLFLIFTLTFVGFSLLIDRFSKLVMEKFATEIKVRLDLSAHHRTNPSWFPRVVDWFLKESGITEKVNNQADSFRRQLRDYELMITQEASQKFKRQHEAQASKDYIEKVKSIRHDIRSPLNSLQAVREAMITDPEAERTLFSAIRRIQVMLDQLEEVDRVAEKEHLLIAEVAADDVVFEVKNKFQQAKGVTLNYEFDHNQLSPINAGREGFNNVIDNLMQNAFDAVGKDGVIKLAISSNSSDCIIQVEDNGCGIPLETESKIFGRGATFGKINGIGLGLFHTKKNIESWGGKIYFERLSQGTRFVVKIPLAQTGVQFVGLDPYKKLKVIDDDHTVPKALKNSGFEILEIAETFEKGQELLAAHHGTDTTVLVDYRLNDSKLGTELIDAHPSRQGILLCTSDYDDHALIKKAKALGVKIMPKPLCYSGQLFLS
ncbi:MAG TPA: ATP-binding protein [Pseudobdellovibrionaceae bacterium]|jgi:signal transduction histidine kinase